MQSIWYLFHFTICSSCDPLHPLVVALPLANLWLPRLNRQQANLQVASKISDYKLLVHFVEKVSVTNISQVSLVTCAKGFNTRTPYSTTVQDCGTFLSSKALVCTTTFNRLKDELLTIFITDPPKKSRLKTANNVSGSGHRVTSNLLQRHPQCFGTQPYRLRSSTLCQLLIVLGSSHGRSIRVQGSVTSIGADKKDHGSLNCHLCGGYWMGDGYQVHNGSHLKCC